MKLRKSFIQFTKAFSTNDACLEYLCDLKWGNGFRCIRCGCSESLKGRTWYYRRCKHCDYDESCTAHTLFHKIKFPLVKAFWITYQLGTLKKGMSTMEISRQFAIHQETAWFFKRKVQQAMHHLQGTIFIVSGTTQTMGEKRRVTRSEYLTETGKNKMSNPDHVIVSEFDAKAHIITDTWPFGSKETNMTSKPENYSERVKIKGPPVLMINLKNWLRGIHHRVSPWHLSFYLDEFFYRFETRNSIISSVPKLYETMILLPWMPYSILKCEQSR